MSGRRFSRAVILHTTLGLSLLLACGDRARPQASDDPGGPGAVGGVGRSSPAANGAGGGGQGGAGGAATGAGGGAGGAAPTLLPDCACLATRAANVTGCRACYDAAETSPDCAAAEQACTSDPNGCLVAVESAKSCPAGAGYADCVATAFAFASATTVLLAADLLDCACQACPVECAQGDACP